jgi:hypothetical protein
MTYLHVPDFFSLLFADDTALTASHHNLDELYDFVNIEEFKKLCTYFRENKLINQNTS